MLCAERLVEALYELFESKYSCFGSATGRNILEKSLNGREMSTVEDAEDKKRQSGSHGGLPPTPPERSGGSSGMSSRPSPPMTLAKVGSVNRKSRAMRLNITSNSVQFDTSTILDDFLYLGAKGVTGDMEKLNGLGVGYIVNCTEDPPAEYPSHIKYLHVAVGDTANDDISKYFIVSSDFIEQARESGKSVLVHCTMGMSRSSSIVLAYLVRHQGMTLAQALVHVKERRPVTSPNPGFMQQLVEFERSIHGKATIDPHRYATARFGDVKDYTVS